MFSEVPAHGDRGVLERNTRWEVISACQKNSGECLVGQRIFSKRPPLM